MKGIASGCCLLGSLARWCMTMRAAGLRVSRRESGGLGQVVSDLQAAERGSKAVGNSQAPHCPRCVMQRFIPNVHFLHFTRYQM